MLRMHVHVAYDLRLKTRANFSLDMGLEMDIH
jgi:hypothetical protein